MHLEFLKKKTGGISQAHPEEISEGISCGICKANSRKLLKWPIEEFLEQSVKEFLEESLNIFLGNTWRNF